MLHASPCLTIVWRGFAKAVSRKDSFESQFSARVFLFSGVNHNEIGVTKCTHVVHLAFCSVLAFFYMHHLQSSFIYLPASTTMYLDNYTVCSIQFDCTKSWIWQICILFLLPASTTMYLDNYTVSSIQFDCTKCTKLWIWQICILFLLFASSSPYFQSLPWRCSVSDR